jgi:hypothetical protein
MFGTRSAGWYGICVEDILAVRKPELPVKKLNIPLNLKLFILCTIPYSTVVLEKLMVAQLVKKTPALYSEFTYTLNV